MPCHAGVLGFGEGLSVPKGAFVHAVLLEPGQSPAGVGIVLALLLGEVLVQVEVDELQSRAHAHGLAVRLQDFAVAGEDGHAGADGRLGQVHGGDVALLKLAQGLGKFTLQGGEKLPAGGYGRVFGARAAD